jgi:hypothetical protein
MDEALMGNYRECESRHDCDDVSEELRGARSEIEKLRIAFLAYVQPTNECAETGQPCNKDRAKCGCWLEMQNWIDTWDAIADEQLAGGSGDSQK